MNKYRKKYIDENGMKAFNNYNVNDYTEFLENELEAITVTRCCTELKAKKGTDFEEFCSEHFIYKNSNTYSKESGLPVSLNDMLQKYTDLKT
jgi:hypothetical protein